MSMEQPEFPRQAPRRDAATTSRARAGVGRRSCVAKARWRDVVRRHWLRSRRFRRRARSFHRVALPTHSVDPMKGKSHPERWPASATSCVRDATLAAERHDARAIFNCWRFSAAACSESGEIFSFWRSRRRTGRRNGGGAAVAPLRCSV